MYIEKLAVARSKDLIALAAVRHVRTAEGAQKFGVGVGSLITKDMLDAKSKGDWHSKLMDSVKKNVPGATLHLHGNDKRATLSKIAIDKEHRGQGHAERIMKDIAALADHHNTQLALSPSADFGGNKAKLTTWYKRHGFVENKGRNKDYEVSESMHRTADPSKKIETPKPDKKAPVKRATKLKELEAPKQAEANDASVDKNAAASYLGFKPAWMKKEAPTPTEPGTKEQTPPSLEEARAAMKEGDRIGSGLFRTVYHKPGDFWAYKRADSKQGTEAHDREMDMHDETKELGTDHDQVKVPQMSRISDNIIAVQYIDGKLLKDVPHRNGVFEGVDPKALHAAHQISGRDAHDDNLMLGKDGNLWMIDLDGGGDL